MQKRGELTSSQIATLLLTIAGFIILLIFLLVILDTEDLSEREICKLSVLTRATAPDTFERLTPLRCTTQKVCLTKGKECYQFVGEENVDDVPVISKETIEEETANAMYDCWKMMGEGKLDIFGGGANAGIWTLIDSDNLFEKAKVCTICSRLAIAEDIGEELLKEVDVNGYMETSTVPNTDKTYLEALTDGQIRSYPREFRDNLTAEKNNVNPTNEIAIVFMQINTPENPWEAAGETGFKSAAFVFLTTTGVSPFGVLSVKPAAIFSAATGVVTAGIAGLQTWRSRQVSEAYCGEFTSVEKARQGCSVVTAMDYSKIAELNDYCDIIEGQP